MGDGNFGLVELIVKEEEIYSRGQSNIEDAHFIRENFIPSALKNEKWNVVVHQSYQALELLIKGMTCLTGQIPRKVHELEALIGYFCITPQKGIFQYISVEYAKTKRLVVL